MTNETHTLHIKNMVCHRCIMAVDHALRTLGLHPLSVELGIAITAEKLTPELRLRVKKALEALEFELIDDRRMQTVQQVKDLIVNLVHHSTEQPIQTNLSDYLARTIGKDYGTRHHHREVCHPPKDRTGQGTADLRRTDAERDSRPDGVLELSLPERPVQERDGAHPYPIQTTERETPHTAG